MWRILTSVYKEGLEHISVRQYVHLLKSLAPAFRETYLSAERDFSYLNESNGSPYSITSLNEFGDVTNYRQRLHQYYQVKLLTQNKRPKNQCIKTLKNFAEYVENQSAIFILLPPAVGKKSYELTERNIAGIAKSLYKNGIAFETSPERYVLHDSLTFDTPYHLTFEGCKIRTQLIVEDLDSVLQNAQICCK